MSKNILLLIDTGFGGYGDVSTLIRLGRFLQSRGYNVYSTLIIPEKAYLPKYSAIYAAKSSIPVITHPEDLRYMIQWFKDKKADFEKGRFSGLSMLFAFKGVGFSLDIVKILKKMKSNPVWGEEQERMVARYERIQALLAKEKMVDIDFEIAVYATHRRQIRDTRIKRILVDQYAGDLGKLLITGPDRHIKECDYHIAPISPEQVEGVLNAGFHTHNGYTYLEKEEVIRLLIKRKTLILLEEHLRLSSWGSYYSGTLGTNGLFFKLLMVSLPKMLRQYGKITYFTFLDRRHFDKYVLPYLEEHIGVVDLNKNEVIVDPDGKDAVVINLFVNSDLMEAIVNISTLCSAAAGDGSFNMLYNRARQDTHFTFFKYFTNQQSFFFRFMINKIHEYEAKHKLGHDVSRCLFAFGYHERLFQFWMRTHRSQLYIDQFVMLEDEQSIEGFFDEKKDFRLMLKMFTSKSFMKKFNTVMRALIAFIEQEDELRPVEDIVLEILEG